MSILKRGKPTQNEKAKSLRNELVNGSNMIRFSLNMPRNLRDKFKRKAFNNQVNMSDIILKYVREYVSS